MKQATLLAVCITVIHFSFASPKIDCATDIRRDSTSMKITSNIHEMLLEIINVTGLQANFELKQAEVLNIEASISHRKRYILYNPSFILGKQNFSSALYNTIPLFKLGNLFL